MPDQPMAATASVGGLAARPKDNAIDRPAGDQLQAWLAGTKVYLLEINLWFDSGISKIVQLKMSCQKLMILNEW